MNNLSESQRQFYEMIKPYPSIAALWDWNERVLKIKSFQKAVKVMSSGEKSLAYFFAAVWEGKDKGFDLLDATALDISERRLIANWLINPFYP